MAKRDEKDLDKPDDTPVPRRPGYKSPPQHGKIKPGEVRNPWGAKGKPKEGKVDPYTFAASQPTTIIIDGKPTIVTAEEATYLVNMKKAVAGDARAHKNVQDERRLRQRMEPVKTAEELRQEMTEQEQRKELSAQIVKILDWAADMNHHGLSVGKLVLTPWVIEAIGDYREKTGLERSFDTKNWYNIFVQRHG